MIKMLFYKCYIQTHIKQFINLQDSRVKSLFKKFEKDVNELENEFNIEFEEIKKIRTRTK